MTTTDRIQLPVPAHALPQRTPRALLDMAHRGLEEAATMRPDGIRYATAHLAALPAELAEYGYGLEEVDWGFVSEPMDPSSDSVRMRIEGTYRIVRLPE